MQANLHGLSSLDNTQPLTDLIQSTDLSKRRPFREFNSGRHAICMTARPYRGASSRPSPRDRSMGPRGAYAKEFPRRTSRPARATRGCGGRGPPRDLTRHLVRQHLITGRRWLRILERPFFLVVYPRGVHGPTLLVPRLHAKHMKKAWHVAEIRYDRESPTPVGHGWVDEKSDWSSPGTSASSAQTKPSSRGWGMWCSWTSRMSLTKGIRFLPRLSRPSEHFKRRRSRSEIGEWPQDGPFPEAGL